MEEKIYNLLQKVFEKQKDIEERLKKIEDKMEGPKSSGGHRGYM